MTPWVDPLAWALGLTLAAAVVWIWYSSELIVSQRPSPNPLSPKDFGFDFEAVTFSSFDGVSLAGWFVPSLKPSDATLILCHGWGDNRSDILERTLPLAREGYHLLYFDFRCHGESGGRRSSLSLLEIRDTEAALAYLHREKPALCRRVGLWGHSLGGAVALTVAALHRDVLAVAAESPFASFNFTVAHYGRLYYGLPLSWSLPTLWLVRRRLGFDPERWSPRHHLGALAGRPILLMAGSQDRRVPLETLQEFFQQAHEPKELWVVPGADHSEVAEKVGKAYGDKLKTFFNQSMAESDHGQWPT